MVEGLTGGKSVEVATAPFTTDRSRGSVPDGTKISFPTRPHPRIHKGVAYFGIFRSKTSSPDSRCSITILRRMSIPSTKVLPWTRSSIIDDTQIVSIDSATTELSFNVSGTRFGRRFHLRHIPHAGTRSIRDLQPRRRIGLCPHAPPHPSASMPPTKPGTPLRRCSGSG